MIFRPELADKIVAGEKTATRRLPSNNPGSPWFKGRCSYKPGQVFAVNPGRGKVRVAEARATRVYKQRLSEVDDQAGRAEGFADREEFLDAFRSINGELPLSTEVWVVEFELVTAVAPAPAAATHPVQRDMLEFFRGVGGLVGETPALRNEDLNADLILEEARETAESITGRRVIILFDDDLPPTRPRSLAGAIDGLCDQLATVYGAAVTFGVDLAPFWEEVHRTNMAKAGGPTRADGKRLKPEGWDPPDIEGLLERLCAAAEPVEAIA
jgi:hypothetical protein